ncbi:Vacuolar protein-sorting-associated protein 27 [Tieghemiomyces parasiticus]|uniref:Vacuolar protein sorting-associated protein 27 n=1 Tax=Tieghemiomyces parasiticus TaxID=78921 RepID=A0A9W7ZTG0_9FUNG|nr:Vacuolar protein-sorting-associated protein 27 [Tieghemiomyces parasiticus]
MKKATSESIPRGQEDYGTNLEISDQIRSKQMPAKEAAKSLRRRIAHKNPNVQLLALRLTDMLVKNGGAPFLTEVANREFMDDLVSLLHAPQSLHYEVQRQLLGLIQEWALAFRSKPDLQYPSQVYHRLKAEGFPFPVEGKPASAIIETATAPEWTDSDVCMRCRTAFTLTNRKHHCRNCGQTFCQQCSSNNIPLPHFGLNDPVRVCHGCYLKVKKVVHNPESTTRAGPRSPGPYRPTVATHVTTAVGANASAPVTRPTDEDEDLKLAIQMSLREAQTNPRNYGPHGLASPSSTRPAAATTTSTRVPGSLYAVEDVKVVGGRDPLVTTQEGALSAPTEDEGEEDPDLAAAIAASLQQMKVDDAQRHSAYGYPPPVAVAEGEASPGNSSFLSMQIPGANGGGSSFPPTPKAYELSTLEKENIQLFASLLARVQTEAQARGDHPNLYEHPQIPYLHEQISKLQPKVARNLAEVVGTHERLLGLHAKIGQAVKKYDQLLDERINLARAGPAAHGNSPYGPPGALTNGYAATPGVYPPTGPAYHPASPPTSAAVGTSYHLQPHTTSPPPPVGYPMANPSYPAYPPVPPTSVMPQPTTTSTWPANPHTTTGSQPYPAPPPDQQLAAYPPQMSNTYVGYPPPPPPAGAGYAISAPATQPTQTDDSARHTVAAPPTPAPAPEPQDAPLIEL